MKLTIEQVLQDDKYFAKCNALAELKYYGREIPHRKSITNHEIHFYAWLCRSAVAMLKEQEAQLVLNIGEQIGCKSGCCPKCGKMLNTTCNKRYCGDCGQVVKWNG